MLLILFLLLSAPCSMASSLSTICVSGGQGWELKNSNGVRIGIPNAFQDKATCELSNATRMNELICSWNGHFDQMYNLVNGVAIGGNIADVESCGTILQHQVHSSNPRYICSWNGNGYSPYNRNTGTKIGTGGWQEYADCFQESIQAAYRDLICGWDGNAALYSDQAQVISSDFKSTEDCNGLLGLMRRKGAPTQLLRNALNGNLQQGFFQSKSFGAVGFPMKECEVKEHRYHLTKSENGYITKDCTPEILYSWGGFDKLLWFTTNLNNKSRWQSPLPRGLYATPTAAGTFGYGPTAIRIKVKPTVQFKLLVEPNTNACNELVSGGYMTAEELSSTIVVRLALRNDGFSFADFIICSPEVIESWSYGTKEHFDEILRDHNWMTTQHYYNWDAYVKINGVDTYLDNTLDSDWEGNKTTYSLQVIQSRMALLRALSASGVGDILANGVSDKPKHFKITKPNYFLRSQ